MKRLPSDVIAAHSVDVLIRSMGIVVTVSLHVQVLKGLNIRYFVTVEFDDYEQFDYMGVFSDYNKAMWWYYDRLTLIHDAKADRDHDTSALIARDNYRQLATYYFNEAVKRR